MELQQQSRQIHFTILRSKGANVGEPARGLAWARACFGNLVTARARLCRHSLRRSGSCCRLLGRCACMGVATVVTAVALAHLEVAAHGDRHGAGFGRVRVGEATALATRALAHAELAAGLRRVAFLRAAARHQRGGRFVDSQQGGCDAARSLPPSVESSA